DITVCCTGRQDEVVLLERLNIGGGKSHAVHFQYVAVAGAVRRVTTSQAAAQCRRALDDHSVVRGIAIGRKATKNGNIDLGIILDRNRVARGITMCGRATVDGIYGTAAYRDDIVTGIASTRAFHVATIDGGSKRSARHHHGVLRGIAILGSATIDTIVDLDIILDRDGVARDIASSRVTTINKTLNDFGIITERDFITGGVASIFHRAAKNIVTNSDIVNNRNC